MARLLWISSRLIVCLFLIQTLVLLERQISAAEITDFLAPYAELMPERLIQTFTPSFCPTYEEYHAESSLIRLCHLPANEGVVIAATVYIRDHKIQQLMFRLNKLYLGDLALRWGRPIIKFHSGLYYAHWQQVDYVIEAPVGSGERITYWSPVSYLTVESGSQQQYRSATPVSVGDEQCRE